MLEKAKAFVKTHKSQIITAAVSAAVGGGVAYVYYHQKTMLHLPADQLKLLVENPEKKAIMYDIAGHTLTLVKFKDE